MRSRKNELESFTRELQRQEQEWQRLVDALAHIEPSTRFLLARSVLEELEAVWTRTAHSPAMGALRA